MDIVNRVKRRLGGSDETTELVKELARLRKEVRHLTSLVEEVRSTQKLIPKIIAAQKYDGKWRATIRSQISALLRAHFVASRPEMSPQALVWARRFRVRSQNDEDGLILALLDHAGIATRTFVEIGSGGTGGNSAMLASELGWRGLMVEASTRGAAVARDLFRANADVIVVQKLVAPGNINATIQEAGLGRDVDLFSVDVDSIDYWLLDALDVETICRPRLIVAEYNAHFGPDRSVTVPDAPVPAGAPKSYFGASLAALAGVCARKGFRLILCEENGINAFFLRNDLAVSLPGVTPGQAYRPMRRRAAGEDDGQMEDVYRVAKEQGLPLVDV
jgi:hypothetical protein